MIKRKVVRIEQELGEPMVVYVDHSWSQLHRHGFPHSSHTALPKQVTSEAAKRGRELRLFACYDQPQATQPIMYLLELTDYGLGKFRFATLLCRDKPGKAICARFIDFNFGGKNYGLFGGLAKKARTRSGG